MKKLIIVLLVFTIAIIIPHQNSEAYDYESLPYTVTPLNPRYLYKTDEDGIDRTIDFKLQAPPNMTYTDYYSVKLYKPSGEFINYLHSPREITVNSTEQIESFSLSDVDLEDKEVVIYEVVVNSGVLMRGAVMNRPNTVPDTISDVYVEFNSHAYNYTIPDDTYSKVDHNDGLLIVHYDLFGIDATSGPLTSIRIFDNVKALPVLDIRSEWILELQGHEYDAIAEPDGTKGFLLLSAEYNEMLYNPLYPYEDRGYSGLYEDLNGNELLTNSHLSTFLHSTTDITDVYYRARSTRFYSPNPFILRLSDTVFKDARVSINALFSPDYTREYIDTILLRDYSLPTAFSPVLFVGDIIHTYDVSTTLQEGDTVMVEWTLENAYGTKVIITNTYDVYGDGGVYTKLLTSMDKYGLLDGAGKIFIVSITVIVFNVLVSMMVRDLFVYALLNTSLFGLFSFLGFVPEYMMYIVILLITSILIKTFTSSGGEDIE